MKNPQEPAHVNLNAHTPGEIAWSVLDRTVTLDGEACCENGTFVWLERTDNAELIAGYPGAECRCEMRRALGLGS